MRDAISLTSYRSRVAEIYSEVGAAGCPQGSGRRGGPGANHLEVAVAAEETDLRC